MSELGYGMSRTLIDRSRHFSALHMNNRNIHVGGGYNCRQCFVTISDYKNNRRCKAIEFASESNHADSYGFGHCHRSGSLKLHLNRAVDCEAIALDFSYWLVEPPQLHRTGGNSLE
jgi:hypothetical protein